MRRLILIATVATYGCGDGNATVRLWPNGSPEH
jgi:hypothetical protein